MKKLFSLSLIKCLLILSFNPLAVASSAMNEANLTAIASKLNSYATSADLLKDIKKASPPLEKELRTYFRANDLMDKKLPKFVATKKNTVVFKDHPESTLELDPTAGTMIVTWKGKQVTLKDTMSLKDIESAINTFGESTKSSFLSLFMNEAHALIFIPYLLFGAVSAYGLFGVAKKSAFEKEMKHLKDSCDSFDGGNISEIVEHYNKLSEANMKVCLAGDSFIFKGYSKEGCSTLKVAKQCFKNYIDSELATNDSSRSGSSTWIYTRSTDEYVPSSSAR